MKLSSLLTTTFILLTSLCASAAQFETSGTISRAIVYRGQALVTRTLDVNLPGGPGEIIVNDLPSRILPESLYAQAPAGIVIHNVRYREHAVQQDTRPEIRRLDVELEQLENEINRLEQEKQLINDHINSINKLENFNITAAASDLGRGLLQFEPLKNLTEYVQSRRGEYFKSKLDLEDKVRTVRKQFDLANRKRSELGAGTSKTFRQAVIAFHKSADVSSPIELNYLVNDASWFPQYNLRATTASSAVQLEYNAVLHQASGEDWNNIKLSLSTAQPSMVSGAPSLDPLFIKLQPRHAGKALSPVMSGESESNVQMDMGQTAAGRMVLRDLTEQYSDLARRKISDARKGRVANEALNSIISTNQLTLLNVDDATAIRLQKEESKIARTEGLSVSYAVPGSTTLPSRTDQQLVAIASISSAADFIHIAAPILTEYVYLQADIHNRSSTILLAGNASMYRDGEFVGTGSVPMVTIGETFKAGFGIDSQVQVRRELEGKKSDTDWVGSDRTDQFKYRIAVENYKSAPVKLQLTDRLPCSEDEKIRIELANTTVPLSKDAEYLRTQRKKGILRWDLDLKPSTTASKATVISYIYTLEYDKNMQIASK